MHTVLAIKNTIKVTIPFSFKGKEFTPSSVIDLDVFILGDQTLDSVYQLVANENKIDNYSYEYEVLESSPKIFSEPTGIAVEFLSETGFDLEGFIQKQGIGDLFQKIQKIASDLLKIDDLDANAKKELDNEAIKKALMAAYIAGKESA